MIKNWRLTFHSNTILSIEVITDHAHIVTNHAHINPKYIIVILYISHLGTCVCVVWERDIEVLY